MASLRTPLILLPIAALTYLPKCDMLSTQPQQSMYQILSNSSPDSPVAAFQTIFGSYGERGEYMDGYSRQDMVDRCKQDYKWEKKFGASPDTDDCLLAERAKMMAHLYDNEDLWAHVCMVGFAEHYVLNANERDAKPMETFQRHQLTQPQKKPIYSGVVLTGWQDTHAERGDKNDAYEGVEKKIRAFKAAGIDYIRLHCNLSSVDELGAPKQLSSDPLLASKFRQLAEVARMCQDHEMVPSVLLQLPWREAEYGPTSKSSTYFKQAVQAFANAAQSAKVVPEGLLFETRPPLTISAQEERALSASARAELGLQTGKEMFEIIDQAFDGPIGGFCVAGGSTKGDVPQAMEDDAQNAVRQGIRQCARRTWGHDLCFWEMGAKLMLQPKVGRLWGRSQRERDAARELFRVNAEDMADEISEDLI